MCRGIELDPAHSLISMGSMLNVVVVGVCGSIYGSDTGINFFSFFIFAFPHMIIILLICWLSLVLIFIGPRSVNEEASLSAFDEVADCT